MRKKWVRKSLIWGAIATLTLLGVARHGILHATEYFLFFFTWYFIAIGVLGFADWAIRYRRIKNFQKKNSGLFYLVLVREQFGNK